MMFSRNSILVGLGIGLGTCVLGFAALMAQGGPAGRRGDGGEPSAEPGGSSSAQIHAVDLQKLSIRLAQLQARLASVRKRIGRLQGEQQRVSEAFRQLTDTAQAFQEMAETGDGKAEPKNARVYVGDALMEVLRLDEGQKRSFTENVQEWVKQVHETEMTNLEVLREAGGRAVCRIRAYPERLNALLDEWERTRRALLTPAQEIRYRELNANLQVLGLNGLPRRGKYDQFFLMEGKRSPRQDLAGRLSHEKRFIRECLERMIRQKGEKPE